MSGTIADKQLRASLATMFNNADDCLFDYADKAANHQQQQTYLDDMREIRIKK